MSLHYPRVLWLLVVCISMLGNKSTVNAANIVATVDGGSSSDTTGSSESVSGAAVSVTYNIDDIREMLGRMRKHTDLDVQGVNGEELTKVGDVRMANILKESDDIELDLPAEEIAELQTIYTNKLVYFTEVFETNKPAREVLRTVSELGTLRAKLGRYIDVAVIDKSAYEGLIGYIVPDDTRELKDLGAIGYSLGSIIEGRFVLNTPFGTVRGTNKKETRSEELILSTQKGDNILLILNGEVVDVVQESNKHIITFLHDDGLKSVYSGVFELGDIAVGDVLSQYSSVGVAVGEGVSLKLELEGEWVNPLILYGEYGNQILNEWLGANSGSELGADAKLPVFHSVDKNKFRDRDFYTLKERYRSTIPQSNADVKDAAILPEDYLVPETGIILENKFKDEQVVTQGSDNIRVGEQ